MVIFILSFLFRYEIEQEEYSFSQLTDECPLHREASEEVTIISSCFTTRMNAFYVNTLYSGNGKTCTKQKQHIVDQK